VQAPQQLIQVRLAAADRPDEHRRGGAVTRRVSHGNRIFVDVQTDEQRSRLAHG
jgi:hypothetical protein